MEVRIYLPHRDAPKLRFRRREPIVEIANLRSAAAGEKAIVNWTVVAQALQHRLTETQAVERILAPPFQIGETLLLRDVHLKRFDTLVEFRGLDDDVALVLCRGRLEVVPLISLRR